MNHTETCRARLGGCLEGTDDGRQRLSNAKGRNEDQAEIRHSAKRPREPAAPSALLPQSGQVVPQDPDDQGRKSARVSGPPSSTHAQAGSSADGGPVQPIARTGEDDQMDGGGETTPRLRLRCDTMGRIIQTRSDGVPLVPPGGVHDAAMEMNNIEVLDMLILSDGNETQGGGIAEVYSPPRIVPIARAKGLVGGWSLDLTSADSQGRVWDFDDPECRRRAEALIDETQPSLLVGSVTCTFFSVMSILFGPRMGDEAFQKALSRAKSHLEFMASLYKRQVADGRYSLHEHPAGANS